MTDGSMDALFGAQVKAGDNQLKNIAGLIAEEGQACDELSTAEALAAAAKERRSELRNKLIPTAMIDAGVREFATDDGIKAKITFTTDGALGSPKTPEEFAAREEKYDLIEAHGGGEIIKMAVVIEFPKDLFGEAEQFREWAAQHLEEAELARRGVKIRKERTVNHMTLGSWIRSKMEEDRIEDRLPLTMLEKIGIWYGEIAKITRPKPKDGK